MHTHPRLSTLCKRQRDLSNQATFHCSMVQFGCLRAYCMCFQWWTRKYWKGKLKIDQIFFSLLNLKPLCIAKKNWPCGSSTFGSFLYTLLLCVCLQWSTSLQPHIRVQEQKTGQILTTLSAASRAFKGKEGGRQDRFISLWKNIWEYRILRLPAVNRHTSLLEKKGNNFQVLFKIMLKCFILHGIFSKPSF